MFKAFVFLLGCILPATAQPTNYWLTGDSTDVQTVTTQGVVLMGGGKDVNEAFRWMIQKAGGGDFVILRASGADGYNTYLFQEIGGLNSVETFLITAREQAFDKRLIQKIKNAEALFIAGGDQGNYVNFWKDTPVEDAINYLYNTKKIPIGGTSAGCVIMTSIYFPALNGSVTSAEALQNPYDTKVKLGNDDFVNCTLLKQTVCDMHFSNRQRQGRFVTFMARMYKDWGYVPKGIGVDERTAVCIEPNGMCQVFGSGQAFFCMPSSKVTMPERCEPNQPLEWNHQQQAIKTYKIPATPEGTGTFNLKNWKKGKGGTWGYFYVANGQFNMRF
ncbi:MAG: cyanophycinase [Spirosomataceae bacterium]